MKSCIKRTIPLLLALVMVVGLLTPFSEASAASKNVINYNISSSAVSSNATDGSLPTKASPVAGQPFYFNIQVSSDLKVKKFQLYVQDVGASKYSNVYTDTANNYFRYDSYKYTFKKTGTVKYYWKLTYTNGTTTTTSKTSVTVATFNQNVSSSKASKNASDGSLPTAASPIYTGSSYYFNFQVSNNLKVKKAQLYVKDVNASGYSNVYTETANNYIRYTSYKYTFSTAGTVKYYWKLTFTDGSVDNFSNNPQSITVKKKDTSPTISTNYTGTSYTTNSKYYVTVNGTKFNAGNTFYTYRKCGSSYIKSTGYKVYCSTHKTYEYASYVKIGSTYVDVAAGQCLAYAHNIQYLLYGKHDGSTSKINSGFKAVSGASGTLSSKTNDNVKSWVTTAGAGAHIRVVTKSGNDHSLIVVSVTSKGFYYTDANSDNKNTIRIGYFSWSSFRSQYKSLSYIRYYTG